MMILKHLRCFASTNNKFDKTKQVQFLKLIKPPVGVTQKLTVEEKEKVQLWHMGRLTKISLKNSNNLRAQAFLANRSC